MNAIARLNGDSFPRLMTLLAMQHFQAISLRWHDLSSTSLSLVRAPLLFFVLRFIIFIFIYLSMFGLSCDATG